MQAVLIVILGWFTRHLIFTVFKYVFTGFLGLVSYGFMQRLISRYINSFISSIVTTDITPIMHLSRLDDALSIIVGALTIKVAIKSMGLKVIPFT